MWLSEISVRRPVFAVMLIGSLTGLGWVSLGRLGVDFFPRMAQPVVTVTTVIEGASPETMETEVTEILEEEISNLAGLDSLISKSSEGVSQVLASFDLEVDAEIAAQDVRDKVALARRELPADVEPPMVEKLDPDALPIFSIMVAGNRSVRELTRYADDVVKERVQRVPGVGSVRIVGGREREVRVWLDVYRLRAYGLAASDVIRAIQTQHAEIPGGRLETPAGASEFSFKTMGEVDSVEEFGEIVVAYREGPIRVRDVARVEDGMEDQRTYAELDGMPGVTLEIRRQSRRNTVEVARSVRQVVDRIQSEAPPDIRLIVARDISRFIESSVNDVFVDLALGGLLAALVTLAFLRSLRTTLIVTLAIPASVISTFLLFFAADITLNLLTLIALTISIGILIDDAIVVLEAIHRRIEAGEAPPLAAVNGTRDVSGAVVAATLAIVGVFVPIAFMEGTIGRLFFEYGLTVVFAVSISLLVAFSLTPMLSSRFLGHTERHGRIFSALERLYARLEAAYSSLLALALRRRPAVLGLAAASIVLAVMVARSIPLEFTSHVDRGEFEARIELPLGTGVSETKRVGRQVQAALQELEHVRSVFMTVGAGSQGRVNEADFYVRVAHKHDRDEGLLELMDRARGVIRRAAPRARRTNVNEVSFVSGGGFTAFSLQYSLQGPSLEALDALSQRILSAMQKSPDFVDARVSYESGKPEVQARVDRSRAADLGVPLEPLAQTLRAMVGGLDIATYEEDGERYDVRVRLEADQRDDPTKLGLIQVTAQDGRLVDLENVASLEIASGPVQIDREDRGRKVDIFANMPAGVALGTSMQRLDQIVAEVGLPEGYVGQHRSWGERVQETAAAVKLSALIAMAALYMILASQFNSFTQPVVVMMTAPLSLVGAFVALAITGTALGALSQIALLALMGLVMKNGILLVDYANQLLSEAGSAREAMLRAGPVRLRPVLMTALSTVGGMIPVAISRADGAEFRTAMGILAIGGMLSSTILTLVVVPVIYTYLDDAETWVSRGVTRIRRWTAGTGSVIEPAP